ncbi:MAG: DNA-3-methyladenine glycosylase I [Candidatus Paceibacterota bacterium]
MQHYHDTEWGVPLHNDNGLFEYLILDAFQAGLSWKTILHRRAGFEKAFAGFDPRKVSQFTEADVERLMQDVGIIRNRMKIKAAITNAHKVLEVQKEFGTFDAYIWQFVGGEPIVNLWEKDGDIPATSPESDAMSKDLRTRGFSFVGSTICYAFMQAAGMVNDHYVGCSRHVEVQKMKR